MHSVWSIVNICKKQGYELVTLANPLFITLLSDDNSLVREAHQYPRFTDEKIEPLVKTFFEVTVSYSDWRRIPSEAVWERI